MFFHVISILRQAAQLPFFRIKILSNIFILFSKNASISIGTSPMILCVNYSTRKDKYVMITPCHIFLGFWEQLITTLSLQGKQCKRKNFPL